jgi:hypothetical protein
MFGDRSVHQITDDEIRALVSNQEAERQDLEFKQTIELRRPDIRLELVQDVVAMANGGGGYIVVGVTENGGGRAQAFAAHTQVQVQHIRQALADWTVQHVSERIAGIETDIREVEPGNFVLLVRIPAGGRRPHMVTLDHSTFFLIRHGDRKREMTIGEIRDAFNNDYFGSRLARVEHGLHSIDSRLSAAPMTPPVAGLSPTGATSADAAFQILLSGARGIERPVFLLAAAPVDLSTRIDLNDNKIREALMRAPGSRQSGWTVEVASSSVRFGNDGQLARTSDDGYGLQFYANGVMEFMVPIDFFNMNQEPEKFKSAPILYPYAVCEFPFSFASMYRAILDELDIHSKIAFLLAFLRIKNANLFPGHPQSAAYSFPLSTPRPFTKDELVLSPPLIVSHDFEPNRVAFQLVSSVYNRFGHGADAVPFFDDTVGKFSF